MAEALAVLGAFSSVLQIIECTTKVVSHTHDILSSGEVTAQEHGRLKRVASDYQALGQASSSLSSLGFTEAAATAEQDNAVSNGRAPEQPPDKLEQLAHEYAKLDSVIAKFKKARPQTNEEETIARLGSECEAESRRLLKQLGAFEIDPAARGGKRLAKALRSAARSLKKRKEVEKIRQNLHELNGQLATAILLDIHTKRRRYEWRPTSEDADRNVEETLSLIHAYKCKALLESLIFPELTERKLSITEAYPATYEWALQQRSELRTWLEEGGGIFWIAGKAGSGKSTLMKFLYDHQETRELLASWAQDSELVTANFYFWYAGTVLQKSTLGLLRSISYQILAADPSLVPIAFPERYESLTFNSAAELQAKEWTQSELASGLSRLALVQADEAFKKRYCFFIDGLDEYTGDHLELVKLLKDLADNEKIKICVSSRPWNAFRSTLGVECPSLLLEKLSRPDIYRFTDERIRGALACYPSSQSREDPDEISALIEEIVNKAEGVFLWVILVVRSIIRGITECDPISMLRHRVAAFPADLNEFFRNILERADPIYKAQTCQSLKLAYMLVQEGGRQQHLSTFVDFWFIAQSAYGLATPDFSQQYADQLQETWCDNRILKMLSRTRNMLCSACKDLLCIPDTPDDSPLYSKVTFLHRTVYDFLQDENMQNTLNENVPQHFKTNRIFHLLNLAALRVGQHIGDGDWRFRNLVQISLVAWHQDLTGAYVDALVAFSEKLYGKKHSAGKIDDVGAMSTLFAFPSSGLGQDLLISECQHDGVFTQSVTSLKILPHEAWLAVLGESEINRFGLDKVNLRLVSELSKKAFCRYDMYLTSESDTCFKQVWLLYLRKWTILARQDRYISVAWDRKQHLWRRFWDTFKTFIPHIFNVLAGDLVDFEFCIDPLPASDHRHRHKFISVGSFLRAELPESWLLEVPDLSFLGRNSHSRYDSLLEPHEYQIHEWYDAPEYLEQPLVSNGKRQSGFWELYT